MAGADFISAGPGGKFFFARGDGGQGTLFVGGTADGIRSAGMATSKIGHSRTETVDLTGAIG